MSLDLPYDLANYTPADALPVQTNFARVEQHINQELIARDGTVAMTGQLKLADNPIAELDAVCKRYVDSFLPIGVVLPFGGNVVPGSGMWAMADGTGRQVVDYPDLYNVLGYRYSPAGTTGGTFHLPNVADRVVVGKGSNQTGAFGGSPQSSVANHNHGFSGSHSGTLDTTKVDTNHKHGMEKHTHGISGTAADAGAHGHNLGNNEQLWWVDPNAWRLTNGNPNPADANHQGALMAAATWKHEGNHTHTVSGGTGNDSDHATWWQSDSAPGIGDAWGGQRWEHKHQFSFTPAGTVNDNSWLAPSINPSSPITAANSNYPPYVVLSYIIRVR